MTFRANFLDQLRALLPENSVVDFSQVIRAVEHIFGTRVLSHIAEHAVLKRRHTNLLNKLHEEGLNVRADANDQYVIDFQRRAKDHHCEEADYRVIQAENGLNGLVSGWEKCAQCGRERHFHREPLAVFGAYFDSDKFTEEAHVPLHTRAEDGALGTVGKVEGAKITLDLSEEGKQWLKKARLNLQLSSACDEDAVVRVDDDGTLHLEGCFTPAQLRRVADLMEPHHDLFKPAGIDVTTMRGRTVYAPEKSITKRIRAMAEDYHELFNEWPTHIILGQQEYGALRHAVPHGARIEWPGAEVSLLIQRSDALSELRCDRLPPDQG